MGLPIKRALSKLYDIYSGRLKPAVTFSLDEEGDVLCGIDRIWSDDRYIGIKGWVSGRKDPVTSAEIAVGNAAAAVTKWFPRPDVLLAHPLHVKNYRCGFMVCLPRAVEHTITVNVRVKSGELSNTIRLESQTPGIDTPYSDGNGLFAKFVDLVNHDHLDVLEIGSRVVSRDSSSKRRLFRGAKSYTGFDIYKDDNTDVVGDAHRLSDYFKDKRFGAVFSVSVFEHLAMPWIVSREINKILEIGGLTFHATHHAWPMHETPWDFWRFSDEGLKVLFSPAMGFEVLKAGLYSPMRLHPDMVIPGQEDLPFDVTFGGSAILARKLGDIDEKKFVWNATLKEVVDKNSHYPKP